MAEDIRVKRFREIYDAAYPRIMAFALRRTRTREDALDIVSETFTVVWRRLADIPDDDKRMVGWVFGVGRRVLANHYRSIRRRVALEARLHSEPSTSGGVSSVTVIHEALARLRRGDREILTLAAWDDLDNVEIAEMLGIPERTVAVRLHRARKRLAIELGALGIPSGGV